MEITQQFTHSVADLGPHCGRNVVCCVGARTSVRFHWIISLGTHPELDPVWRMVTRGEQRGVEGALLEEEGGMRQVMVSAALQLKLTF